MSNSIEEIARRFWSKVDVRGVDECWPWLAGTDNKGYGQFWVGGKQVGAHQVALWLATGEIIGDGMVTRHIVCNNPPCCNPSHICSGTQQQNVSDMVVAGRQARGERIGGAKLTEVGVLIAYDLMGQFPLWQIAKILGVGTSTICSIHRGSTWSWLTGATRQRGGRNKGKSKLTEIEVLTIFSMRGKCTQTKIARTLGVSKSTITKIHTGKNWGWLTGEGQ